jgi:glycosyltransferase involved in cell wall biosynthesis
MAPMPAAKTSTLPSVSVVMATYRRRDLLPDVLTPLLADPATKELVVVVDGCRDGSMELLHEMAERDSRVIPVFIENRGRGRAQQAGIDAASKEVVLLLDDDVIAEPDLVTGHARHHAAGSGLVVLGYMRTVLPEKRAPGQFATFMYADVYETWCAGYRRDPDSVLRWLWGGNVSVRRSDLRRVPLYSREYTSFYHSDQDFGLRCRKAGLVGVFDPALAARHAHSRSLDAFLRDAHSQGAGELRVHQLHRDQLGAIRMEAFNPTVKGYTRAAIRACRNPLAYRGLTTLWRGLLRLAGSLRLFTIETKLARLLHSVERQRGALELLEKQMRSADDSAQEQPSGRRPPAPSGSRFAEKS